MSAGPDYGWLVLAGADLVAACLGVGVARAWGVAG